MAKTRKITQMYLEKKVGEIKSSFFAACIENIIVNIPKYVPVIVPKT